MKISIVLLSALAGFASAAFPGTDQEFLETIAAGNVPEGILPEEPLEGNNLRVLREPRDMNQRCGRNTPCKEGLECMRTGVARYCLPEQCVKGVIESFINRHDLQDYPQQIMEKSGYMGKPSINATVAKNGWAAVAKDSFSLLDDDFRTNIAATMEQNQPNMKELLFDVLQQCPHTGASESGVTVMLGFHYELAAILPKFFNNFYFAIGTADFDINLNATFNNETAEGDFEGEYNITGGIFTDVCAGVGPDIGVEAGLTGGIFLSGKSADLAECSFMFDVDAGVGTSFGTAVGVTSTSCVTKLMFNTGFGFGGGIGFNGCGTCLISEINVDGSVEGR